MLVMLLGQTRVLYSMANDGLLPKKFFADDPSQVPHPLEEHDPGRTAGGDRGQRDADRRYRQDGEHRHAAGVCHRVHRDAWSCGAPIPSQPRPFRTPWVPLVPILGIIFNGYMMYKLGWVNWARLIIWLAIGLVVYFIYGQKHSRVQAMPVDTEAGPTKGVTFAS